MKALLADPRMPPELKEMLGKLGTPSEPAASGGAPKMEAAAILPRIKSALEARAETLTAQVTDALKMAFTEAIRRIYFWEMFVVGAALLLALFLPGGALGRKESSAQAAPPAGH
jgi:hypothetical protein